MLLLSYYMEKQQERKQNYLNQLDEAIRELNAAFVEYDNIEFLINIKNMNDAEKIHFAAVVNKIRIYESHCYIRLKTIEKEFDSKYSKLLESRAKIKIEVPDKKDVEELVLQYNKIQLKELDSENFFKTL